MSRTFIDRLDPELKDAIVTMLRQPSAVSIEDIPAWRAAARRMTLETRQAGTPFLDGLVCADHRVPGPPGAPEVRVRSYRPAGLSGSLPALFWIHGGGYMFGDLDDEDPICARLARGGQCAVFSVDYRLAPENPYPAPLEDCYAALKWLAARAPGVDPNRIAVGGASAGGGLAAGLVLLARDRAEVQVIFQLLVYPMLDDCNIQPASAERPDSLLWTRAANLQGWSSYLGRQPGGPEVPAYASVCRAADLRDLPPVYLAAGDLDLFTSEDIEYARRLNAAGVPTEIHIYPGGCHAFDNIVPAADISRRFNADIQRALKRALYI